MKTKVKYQTFVDFPDMYTIKDILLYGTERRQDKKEYVYLNFDNEVETKTTNQVLYDFKGLGQHLYDLGIRNKKVAILSENSYYWIACYYSIATGRNAGVPLDPKLPDNELVELMVRSGCDAIYYSEDFAKTIELMKAEPECKIKDYLRMEDFYTFIEQGHESLKNGAECYLDDEVLPDDLAFIVYTSGTTGKSKGVMLSQGNLAENVKALMFSSGAGVPLLNVLPIHHAFCLVMDWLNGFWMGAVICINDSLMHMVRNMSIFEPDVMLMVPLMVETIYKRLRTADRTIPTDTIAKKVFGRNLKYIFTGGAHLEPYYIEEFKKYGIDVYEGYGMSECSPVISSNKIGDSKAGSIGRPLPNVEIKFVNGEILVRSTSVMKGYYKMEEETEETLKDGWLHTGDKGYIDEDGFLFINGRVKNLIILSNGENISPEEIETRLGVNDLIGEIVVTGEDNMLTARIFPDPEMTGGMTDEEIHSALQEILNGYNSQQPTYKQLSKLVVRKYPFLKNTTKKIIRAEVYRDEQGA